MSKNLKHLVFVFLLGSIFNLNAQQLAQFTQDMVNPYLVNPAFSGVEDFLDIKMGVRNQWVGIDGAPATRYLSAHSGLGKTHYARTKQNDYHNWHGVGGVFINDQAGNIKTNSLYANYAYNLKLTEGKGYNRHHSDGMRLALGTFIGVTKYGLDASKLTFENSVGEQAGSSSLTKMVPDASIGGMIYQKDKFYAGMSVMNILGTKVTGVTSGASELSRFVRHYYFIGSYKFPVGNDLYLMPTLVGRYAAPLPLSVDVNLRLDYKDIVFGGISYRNQDAIALLLGVVYNDMIEVAYSYDITISELRPYSKGTHEIVIGARIHPRIYAR